MNVDVVTGGAGFIGSHLVAALVAAGRTVRVVDDLSTGATDRLAPVRDRITFVRADLAASDLAPIVDGAERIFHLAAVPSVSRSVSDPLTTHHASATATLRLLSAARDAKVARFVHSSSSSVYGDTRVSPKHEELPLTPISPYGVAKAAAEGYVRVFGRLFGMPTVALRYFNVFGPSQDPNSRYAAVIPLFITRALAGRSVVLFGDGTQTRDFTYVDNVVSANLAAASADAAPGSVYNIAAGEPHSLRELIDALQEILDLRITVDQQEPRAGDILHSHAAIAKATAELGWRPTVDFRDGLRRTVEWYRRHPAP